jgi:hypothetical protein
MGLVCLHSTQHVLRCLAGHSAREEAHGGTASSRAAAAGSADDDADRVELEVDFHWVGEPNISFFVELAMAG